MSNNALTALVLAALDDSAIKTLEERVNEIAEAGFKPEIVDSLPATGNDHTLYLVPNDNNGYDEYLYVNNSWEQIGDTNIDFSDYYTKEEIDNMIGGLDSVLKQYEEMPTAEAALEGQIAQYIGDTTQDYNNAYFYKCVEDESTGTYIWEQIDVQGNNSIPETVVYIDTDIQLMGTAEMYNCPITLTDELRATLNRIKNLGYRKVAILVSCLNQKQVLLTFSSFGSPNKVYTGYIFKESIDSSQLTNRKLSLTILDNPSIYGLTWTLTNATSCVTKQYVDDAVASAGGAEVVDELPQTGDEDKIYIVKEGDIYHQYIYNTTDGWEEIGAGNSVEMIGVPVSLLTLQPGMTTAEIIECLGGQDNVDKLLDALENGKPIFSTALNPITGEYVQIPMNIETTNITDGEQIYISAVVDGNSWVMDLVHYDNGEWVVTGVNVIPLATQDYVNSTVANKQDIIQYEVMPIPSVDNEGNIIQYIGDTNQNYTQGYFYICVSDGGDPATYSWEQIDVQDAVDLSNYYTKNEIDEKIKIDVLDIGTFSGGTITDADTLAKGSQIITSYRKLYSDQKGASGGVLLLRIKTGFAEEARMRILTNSISDFNLKFSEYTFKGLGFIGIYNNEKIGVGFGVRFNGNWSGETFTCTSITPLRGTSYSFNDYLSKTNTTSYTPTSNYNPATKKYVDDIVASAMSAAIKREVVQELPVSNIKTDTIYMVPSSDPGTENAYDEFMYINNAWEKIGNTEIDLTDYATKDYVDGKDVCLIPATVIDITPLDSSETIITKMGGQDKITEILDAIDNHSRFIAGSSLWNGQDGNVPMTVISYINNGVRILYLEGMLQGDLPRPVYIAVHLREENGTWSCTSTTPQVIASLDEVTMAISNSTDMQYPGAYSTGQIIQYVGPTTNEYINGHFYQVVPDETGGGVHWEQVNVQDSDLVFLAGTMFAISTDDSSAAIVAKLGGQDKVDAILDAIQNQDKFIAGVSEYGGQYANAPVFITSVENGGVRTIIFESTMQGLLDKPTVIRIVLTEDNGTLQCTEASTYPLANANKVGEIVDTMPTTSTYPYNNGQIVQYMGPTTNEYIQGHYYHVVYNETTQQFEWQEVGDFVSHPELAEIVNNINLNNLRYNFPIYYVDALEFSTEEPYVTPPIDDIEALIVQKVQQAYDAGHDKFYLVFRNANEEHPIRYFPVLIEIDDEHNEITTTGYKQVGSVNSTQAVSYTVSLDYGTWSISNGVISHTGEHVGALLVSKSTFNYLAKDNRIYYVPAQDYNPATKKYVDDTVNNGIAGGVGVPAVEIMPTANEANFGKVVIYSGCEENVYWMPGHMYQCQQWEDEQHNISYHWVEMAKRDAYDFFMPEATEENYDLIIQYKGQDTNDYKKGYFYRCAAYTDQGTVLYRWEPIAVDNYLKKDNTMSYTPTADYNPTTKKYVDDLIKPVVIWESNDPSTYLTAISANISASPAWQLTNLDMTPFKRIKIYTCAGQGTGTTASASTTAAMILEMSLDPRAAISAYGGNYVGSIMSQKPNDNNRLATLTCAVSADKTSFVVLRQTNLYGTAATANNDVNANVFLIEGYYY